MRRPERYMVVTDLDGTLFQGGRRISEPNLRALERLGARGVVRVIATGRSLYSARRVLPAQFPLDYLLFSSGAGIVEWRTGRLLRRHSLRPAEVREAFGLLQAQRQDFMLHFPIPHNHRFFFFRSGRANPDFDRRLAIYREFAEEGTPGLLPLRRACQFVVVEPEAVQPSRTEELRRFLPGLQVIRTTSPLDARSRWIEIFPAAVSKARSAAWVAARAGASPRAVLAVGNDYNDQELLEWAPYPFLVRESPEELRRRFPTARAPGAEDSDFAEAVALWKGIVGLA